MTTVSRAGAGGFDEQAFNEFIDARVGTGDTIYYYGVGDLLTFPKFEPVARLETLEVIRRVAGQDDRRGAEQLSRRLLRYLNPENGAVLVDAQGSPRADYSLERQHVVYRLNDRGFVDFDCRQSNGSSAWNYSGGAASEFNRLGDMAIASLPVNVSHGGVEYWETQDFLIHPEGNPEPRYQSTWYWYGTAPAWLDTKTCSMHGHQWRYDGRQDLPDNIRAFLDGEGAAWAEPPASPAEVG